MMTSGTDTRTGSEVNELNANNFFIDLDSTDINVRDPLPFDLYAKEKGQYYLILPLGSQIKPGVEPYKKILTLRLFAIREDQSENLLNYFRSGKKPYLSQKTAVGTITDDIFDQGQENTSAPQLVSDYSMAPQGEPIFIDLKIGVVTQKDVSAGVIERQYGPSPLEAKGLADYVFNLNELENSMGQIRKVIRNNPKNWQSHVALAKCYFIMGWIPKAKATITDALKYKKNDPDINLFDAFLDQQVRIEKAKKMESKKRDDELREMKVKKTNADLDRIFGKTVGGDPKKAG